MGVCFIYVPVYVFVGSSGGCDGVTRIQTRTRLNDPQQNKTPWPIKHKGWIQCVTLMAHPEEGFVVASGGSDGVTRIETITFFNGEQLSRTPWKIQDQGIFSMSSVNNIFFRTTHASLNVISLLSGRALRITNSMGLTKNFHMEIKLKNDTKQFDQICVENAVKLMLIIGETNCFHFISSLDIVYNPLSALIFSQKIPNYMAHAHFFHEGKLRFYIARRVPTGVAVSEYEVQNLPKEN